MGQLPDGHYISEKDPGYPYLAAPFESLGIIRWAPLFYGALACVGLFVGARRWLGRFGGPCGRVVLLLRRGARVRVARLHADVHRRVAGRGRHRGPAVGGAGDVREARRRTWVGLAGFVAIELATFVRYTNVVILGCAVTRQSWCGDCDRPWCRCHVVLVARSVVVFAAGVPVFDDRIYGGPLKTGYQSRVKSLRLSAVGSNLRSCRHTCSGDADAGAGSDRAAVDRRARADAASECRPVRRGGASRPVGRARASGVLVSLWALYAAYTGQPIPPGHCAGGQVLCPGARCDCVARRVAGDEDSGRSWVPA